MQRLKHSKDFWSGLVFAGAGFGFLSLAPGYDLGSAARPGPGFFPAVLATGLILVGIAIIARGFLTKSAGIERIAIVPMAIVVLSTVVFAVFIERFGAVAAIVGATLVASYASCDFRWQTRLALATGLTAFCVVVLIFGLGLPIPLFSDIFGGR